MYYYTLPAPSTSLYLSEEEFHSQKMFQRWLFLHLLLLMRRKEMDVHKKCMGLTAPLPLTDKFVIGENIRTKYFVSE